MPFPWFLGCADEPEVEPEAEAAPDAACEADGELTVDLPLGGALETLALTEVQAAALLGGEPTWRGNLRGFLLDEAGFPAGDGEIPASFGNGEVALVRVGWASTWCAGEREVTVTVTRTEAFARCGPAIDPCGDDVLERPQIDAGVAIQAVVPPEPVHIYAVYHLSGEASETPFWQVTWHEGNGQVFALVDARTAEILPCREDGPDTCRDGDTPP